MYSATLVSGVWDNDSAVLHISQSQDKHTLYPFYLLHPFPPPTSPTEATSLFFVFKSLFF